MAAREIPTRRLISLIVAVLIVILVSIATALKATELPSTTAAGPSAGFEISVPEPVYEVGVPVRLRIPRIEVDADIEQMGLTLDGKMGIPAKASDVGWYSIGVRPGRKGNAALAGHLDTTWKTSGVFWDLHKLQKHDLLYVDDSLGHTFAFEVTGSAVFDKDSAPLEEIFGWSNKARLNLITCNGVWVQEKRNYDKRLVVFAEAIEQN